MVFVMNLFNYCSGEEVCQGDRISVSGKKGFVERVIAAKTLEAKDYSCVDTGGMLLRFESGDLQLWPWMNEDLEFIGRAI